MSAPTTVRRPMYREVDDLGYLPAPQAGIDYVESPARRCLYVPCQQFRNRHPDGTWRRGWSERCALYRLIGSEGLLYVGIALHPEQRWDVHKAEKPWWPDVLVKTVDWYEDRYSAEVAEYLAIRHERPRCNARLLYPRLWWHQRFDACNEINERFR